MMNIDINLTGKRVQLTTRFANDYCSCKSYETYSVVIREVWLYGDRRQQQRPRSVTDYSPDVSTVVNLV